MVFARSPEERTFALELGAAWAGDTSERSPQPCAAIIDTTPVWTPVVEALKNLEAGGRLVINAIRKEATDQQALLDLDYPDQLWREKEIKSVANVTRRDVQALLQLAAEIPLRPEVECYALDEANRALLELKRGHIRGAKVLVIDSAAVPVPAIDIYVGSILLSAAARRRYTRQRPRLAVHGVRQTVRGWPSVRCLRGRR